jgi:two-component system, chemotaxis family, CheB/CheR fusion protein
MHRVENTVYVIDPDEAVHDALTTLLGATGTKVVCYFSAETFLDSDLVKGETRGCILLEASLPGMGSLALLKRLRHRGIELPVVVLTSTSNSDIADQALLAGALDVIEKPLVGDRLLELLRGLTTDTSKFEFGNR